MYLASDASRYHSGDTIVIDGAYRAPREVNYWLGIILMKIVLGLSLTGYLLPWNTLSFNATRVGGGIAGATPLLIRSTSGSLKPPWRTPRVLLMVTPLEAKAASSAPVSSGLSL